MDASLVVLPAKKTNMKKVIMFLYWITGIKAVVSLVESAVLRYKLRVRMVPTSFKVFIWSLGLVSGVSGYHVYLGYENLTVGHSVTFEQVSSPFQVQVAEAQAPKVETVEETIRRVAEENNFPYTDILVKVAKCESNFNPIAENSTSSAKGVFQILDMHGLTAFERFDVEKSTKWTVDKIEKAGFKPWEASKSCWNK